jgi:integrase
VLKRPKRKRPEDLNVVSVTAEDVLDMLEACADWPEFICVTTAVYLGARRAALARVRQGDIDLVHGTIRFFEKGSKVAVKPLPSEYQAILLAAEQDGLWSGPDDYLIPNRRPASVRRVERLDKIVWNTVKRVAARAGIRAHVHALRGAFAVNSTRPTPTR